MATWHPTIEALENFDMRREFWDDKDPRVSVTLTVNAHDVAEFVNDLVWQRYLLPADLYSPNVYYGQLRVRTVEIINDRGEYEIPDAGGEVLEPQHTKRVTVTYGKDLRQCYDIWGLTVWVSYTIQPQVEFLQMNWNDFQWVIPGGDPIPLRGPDEAPGKRFNNAKYHLTLERVALDSTFRENLNNANGCVNENAHTEIFGLFDATAEQVLFTYEGAEPSIVGPFGDLMWNVKVVLSHKITLDQQLSTWNRFFKPSHAGGNDISGWFEIQHKKTATDATNPVLKAYPLSTEVDDFLDAIRCDQSESSSPSAEP